MLQGRLTVQRKALIDGLTLIVHQYCPRHGEEAILSYDEANLLIDVGGISAVIPATGFWRGQMKFRATVLLQFRKVLPKDDPVLIDVEDGALRIGNTTMGGQWQPAWSSRIGLPVNATFPMMLALKYRYTEQEIDQSGLLAPYQRAWAKADKSIEHASNALKSFGIHETTLRSWVEAHLKQNTPQL